MNQTSNVIGSSGIRRVIAASSVGTMIEWYDFYIFGSLASIIGKQLFPADTGASALINTLAIFAAGFIVRPFGALVFGRLGDMIGRKYTFLLTLILMGSSTFAIGLIPNFSHIGYAAPILVLLLRLIQGLALGGEYGGAATYVAEHSPAHKRGFFTSWIQTTATLGLFLSLGVIVFTKNYLGKESFESWGWRIPFLISIVLVGISVYIRLQMKESPLYARIKSEGRLSLNPIRESFRHRGNFKMVLLALFGAVMGQGVIWYTGQFYAQSFLENTCKIEFDQSRYILLWAIALAAPFFIFFGWLSDKIGRKWIMLAGMLLGVLSYRPIFNTFLQDSKIDQTIISTQGLISQEPAKITKTELLPNNNVLTHYASSSTLGNGIKFKIVSTDTNFYNGPGKRITSRPAYVDKIIPASLYWKFIGLVFLLILFVTMVYGPIAAFLVELFPTRIRYTSMSLPYHIGNGVFGGLVPFLATLITSFKGTTPLSGLWYPISVAGVCFVIGLIYLRNKKNKTVMS
jgi:MFS family permease